MRRPWWPRCCLSCGDPLEEWRWPWEPGVYRPCVACGLLFVATDDALELVAWEREPPELRQLFDQFLAAHYAAANLAAAGGRDQRAA